MRLHVLFKLVIALAAILATAPVSAQLYKWVDEHGVTNYSNQPPSDPKAARNLKTVEDRVSVYTPDKGLLQAVETARQGIDQRLYGRIESLERELQAERLAREYAAAANAQASRAAYDQAFDSGYYPYAAPVVFVPARQRRANFGPTMLQPGAIVGNINGLNSFIPGNSAAVAARNTPPPRPLFERRR